MRHKKVLMGVAATVAALGLGGGVALAAWSVSGTGSGAAGATVASSLVVTQVVPTGAAASLYPGGPPAAVYYTIQNPNPFAVTVTAIAWGTPTSNNTTACPNANVAIDAAAPTSVSIPVAANTTSSAFSEPGVLDMLHTAPNGCQGVSFNVPMTITGAQQ